MLRRTLVLLQLGLVLLTCTVPMVATGTDDPDDARTYRLIAGLAHYWTIPRPRDDDLALSIRLVRLLLLVLVLLLAATVVVTLLLNSEHSRRPSRITAVVTAVLLGLDTLALLAAQNLVDDNVDGAALQPGPWWALLTAAALLSFAVAKGRLDPAGGAWPEG